MKFLLLILARILFAGLVLFELLNYIGVLHFHIEFTWLGLMITALGVWGIAEVILWRVGEHMPPNTKALALFATSLVVYIDALADINRWYDLSHFDNLMHFIGGSSACILLFVVFDALRKNAQAFRVSLRWASYITFVTAVSLGVLYEFEEYLEDVFTGSHRLGDGPDTANDLLMNTLGAAIFVLILSFIRHREEVKHARQK